MSFILDALRKSENERKRNELPGLADARVQQKDKSRKLWIPLVALLLGLNLSLLIVMWLMGNQNTAVTAPAPPPASQPDVPNNPPEPALKAAVGPSRTLADQLEPQQIPAAAPDIRPEPDIPVIPKAAPVNPDTIPDTAQQNNLPTLFELTLDGSIEMAPLHLDIHVFSEQPDERFVFINMSKYREGERISEGPVITEIIETGVVMKYQGRSFLLLRD